MGREKNYGTSSKQIFWPTMKCDFYHYVETCHIFQVSKGTVTNAGLFILLSTPTKPWVDINIDFVLGLSHTQRGYGFNI